MRERPDHEAALTPEQKKFAEMKIDDKPYLFALDHALANAEKLTSGKDSAAFVAAIEKAAANGAITEEEKYAIEDAKRMLSHLGEIKKDNNRVDFLKRAASKLEDLIVAQRALRNLPNASGGANFFTGIKYLVDAVYAVASKEQQVKAGEALTGMTAAELEKKRKELNDIDVSAG